MSKSVLVIDTPENYYGCPFGTAYCGGRLKLKSKGKYCDKCGQKLDWGRK